jgi:hydroxyacylglutathione hydrolase
LPALAAKWKCPTFGPAREVTAELDHRLREGDRFEVPGLGISLETLDIPGHTAGHIALHGEGMVFSGDTLFACGCGRVFEGTAAQMLESLMKLARLPGDTRVYCGHEYTVSNIRFAQAVEPANDDVRARIARERVKRDGDVPTLPSTIGDELATNPFLRAGLPGVMASAAAHAKRPMASIVDSFATLRQWKNEFR